MSRSGGRLRRCPDRRPGGGRRRPRRDHRRRRRSARDRGRPAPSTGPGPVPGRRLRRRPLAGRRLVHGGGHGGRAVSLRGPRREADIRALTGPEVGYRGWAPQSARGMRTHPSSRPTRAAACLLIALALFWLGAGAAPASAAGLPTAASTPTWERTGGSGPPARADAAMAFDPDTGTTVLFGGRGVNGLLADTWTWDGSGWTEGTPTTAPPAVESATMAYDAASHQLLLFGGAGTAGQPTADTWTWDGTTWTRLTPAASPPARSAASLVYDPTTATAGPVRRLLRRREPRSATPGRGMG